MTQRERFLRTMTFGQPDRPSAADYFAYDSTRLRWEAEGLPKAADLNEYFHLDFDPFQWRVPHNQVYRIVPDFGRQTLEETDTYIIERRPAGEVVKILKNNPPPAMPLWLSYPVGSKAEWRRYKRRLDPDTPGRLPEDFAEHARRHAARGHPYGMWLGGTYGYLRNWWGIERASLMFYDDPAVVEETVEVMTHLASGLLDRVLAAGIRLDWVMFWEDMACKTGSLLSPAMYRKFCMPFYRTLMEKVRSAGIPVAMLDCDGNIEELIPLWLEEGVYVMHPMEVAAGMDVAGVRKRYGRRIGFFGGVDKRLLAGGKERMKAELVPLLERTYEDGGFIAACDHAVPPDVSFSNYCYFREILDGVVRRRYGH